MFKFKEQDNIISVIDENDTIVARYTIDYHWTEKNISVKDRHLNIRLYSRTSGYIDCIVELNNDSIQKIPQKTNKV